MLVSHSFALVASELNARTHTHIYSSNTRNECDMAERLTVDKFSCISKWCLPVCCVGAQSIHCTRITSTLKSFDDSVCLRYFRTTSFQQKTQRQKGKKPEKERDEIYLKYIH